MNPLIMTYTAVQTLTNSQIGYNITSSITSGTLNTTPKSLTSLSVPVGVWLIIITLNVSGVGAGSGNGTTATIYEGSSGVFSSFCVNSAISYTSCAGHIVRTNNTTNQTYSLWGSVNNNTSGIINAIIQATRIA